MPIHSAYCAQDTQTVANDYRRSNYHGTLQRLLTHILTQRDDVFLINFFIVVPTDVFVGPEFANVTLNKYGCTSRYDVSKMRSNSDSAQKSPLPYSRTESHKSVLQK